MITRFSAKNYGCIKDVTCALTPLHAFIGPNDSGKSTLLRAIAACVRSDVPYRPIRSQDSYLRVAFSGGQRRAVGFNGAKREDADLGFINSENYPGGHYEVVGNVSADDALWVGRGARMARLDADALREPSPLLTSLSQVDLASERGMGLAGVLDYLRDRNEAAYQSVRADVYRLFPSVSYLGLRAVEIVEPLGKSLQVTQGKTVEIKLQDGTEVDASRVSEGLLYYLGYRALQYVSPTAVLLVEEPENGLHPARIAEVVGVLRSISTANTQVVLATHSPLVINELQPEEVSVVTRTAAAGTRVTPMKETANFASRSKVYALGELWLSYANGVDESPLIDGGPSPAVVLP